MLMIKNVHSVVLQDISIQIFLKGSLFIYQWDLDLSEGSKIGRPPKNCNFIVEDRQPNLQCMTYMILQFGLKLTQLMESLKATTEEYL